MCERTTKNGERAAAGRSDQWAALPDIVLERVFELLPLRNLGRCMQTCYNWYRVIMCSARPWRMFIFRDHAFTRRKFTTFAGWQKDIDHWKIRFLITNTTRKWNTLVVKPVTMLYNLYDFMRVLTNFTEYYENEDEFPLSGIRTFTFDWQLDEIRVVTEGRRKEVDRTTCGTGGQVLATLANLLMHFHGLKSLALRSLQLDKHEAHQFLNELAERFGDTLETLCILNVSKLPVAYMQLGLFLNVRKLILSPQNVDDDVLFLVASLVHLADFILIQDDKTADSLGCTSHAWKTFASLSAARVHTMVRGWRCDRRLPCTQPAAPVYSIRLDTPACAIGADVADVVVANYGDTLVHLRQHGLQRRYAPRSMHSRCDRHLVNLLVGSPLLETVACRERLSTMSVLILAHLIGARNAARREQWGRAAEPVRLYVRRNAMIKKADWLLRDVPCDWPPKYYSRVKQAARDYDDTEAMARAVIGYDWRPFDDGHYMSCFETYVLKY